MGTNNNEKDLTIKAETPDVKWMRVPNVVEPYDRVALMGDDIFFQLEVFGLSRSNLVAWFVEKETGMAFITKSGKIFISAGTAISMLEESKNPELEKFESLVSKIHQQAINLFYPTKIKVEEITIQ